MKNERTYAYLVTPDDDYRDREYTLRLMFTIPQDQVLEDIKYNANDSTLKDDEELTQIRIQTIEEIGANSSEEHHTLQFTAPTGGYNIEGQVACRGCQPLHQFEIEYYRDGNKESRTIVRAADADVGGG